MTVEPIANGCLRVWLTNDELEQWGLTAAETPLIRARRLVRRIAASAGWPRTAHMVAELIPVEGGGVLLIQPQFTSADTPLVYHLADTDALLDLIRHWGNTTGEEPLCSVYAGDAGYDLVVYATQPLCDRRLYLLEEYAIPTARGDVAAARCGEYGRPLWVGKALTTCVPSPPALPDPLR